MHRFILDYKEILLGLIGVTADCERRPRRVYCQYLSLVSFIVVSSFWGSVLNSLSNFFFVRFHFHIRVLFKQMQGMTCIWSKTVVNVTNEMVFIVFSNKIDQELIFLGVVFY